VGGAGGEAAPRQQQRAASPRIDAGRRPLRRRPTVRCSS
jgi:hypothetical protein